MATVLAPARPGTQRAHWPVVTCLLVLLNVAVFFLGPALTSSNVPAGTSTACARTAFNAQYGAVPKELMDNQQLPQQTLRRAGGEDCPTPSYTKNPPISALTSLFVHANAMHLLGNMVMLLLFAGRVEKRLGSSGFAALYLISGYTAAYGFAFTDPGSVVPLVGASGAIAGVAGAYLWIHPRERLMALAAALFLLPLPFSFIGTSHSAAGQVAWVAHVVGFIVGGVMAMLFVPRGGQAGAAVPTSSRDGVRRA
jgi:membrane associated rhomboid family serine protease